MGFFSVASRLNRLAHYKTMTKSIAYYLALRMKQLEKQEKVVRGGGAGSVVEAKKFGVGRALASLAEGVATSILGAAIYDRFLAKKAEPAADRLCYVPIYLRNEDYILSAGSTGLNNTFLCDFHLDHPMSLMASARSRSIPLSLMASARSRSIPLSLMASARSRSSRGQFLLAEDATKDSHLHLPLSLIASAGRSLEGKEQDVSGQVTAKVPMEWYMIPLQVVPMRQQLGGGTNEAADGDVGNGGLNRRIF